MTRDWNEQTPRSENDQIANALFAKTEEADRKVVERVAEVAANRGIHAHRWVLHGCCKKKMQPRLSGRLKSVISRMRFRPYWLNGTLKKSQV
ncbi:hypothetical protein ASF12_07480 [Paenibacillus sp. Leaf72]|nr:hypothetical protein ASF12_07480 [Paenibacillus sp. Leaf72]